MKLSRSIDLRILVGGVCAVQLIKTVDMTNAANGTLMSPDQAGQLKKVFLKATHDAHSVGFRSDVAQACAPASGSWHRVFEPPDGMVVVQQDWYRIHRVCATRPCRVHSKKLLIGYLSMGRSFALGEPNNIPYTYDITTHHLHGCGLGRRARNPNTGRLIQ